MKTPPVHVRKRLLHWCIAVACVLSLVCIAALAALAWWRTRDPVMNAAPIASPAPAGAAGNWSPATFSLHAPDGVIQTSANSWSVKGGRAFMQVRRKNEESLELRFVYPFDGFVPPETIDLVRIRWNGSQVEKRAADLEISAEQLAALRSISPATDIPVTAEDRERLKTLFSEYDESADKSAAEKALVAAVTELDATYHDRTRDLLNNMAEEVRRIFTPDQLTALFQQLETRPPRP